MTQPADIRDAAWRMAASGDLAGAEAHLSHARLQTADAGEAWFATALLRLARDDHDGARAAFIAAARARLPAGPARTDRRDRLRAYDPALDRYAALGILDDDFRDDFLRFAVPRAIRPAERQSYALCIDRACRRLGPTEAARALLDADRALNGETMWGHVNLGHHRWLDGNRGAADTHYLQARALAVHDAIMPAHFNRGALVWLAADAASRLVDAPAPRVAQSFARPRSGPAELVIAVGCDVNYFVFLPKLLLSIVAAHQGSADPRPVAVHCHVADPTPPQEAFLRQAAALIAEATPFLALGYGMAAPAHRHPDWYAGLRFLALPEILEHYGCGVVALDVDCALQPAFFDIAERLRAYDFGLRMYSFDDHGRQVSGEPWSIGAHPTYIADRPAGRRVAGFLRAYLHAAYDPALPTNWTIDQCAIAQAYDLIVRPDPRLSVLDLARAPPGYVLPQDEGGKHAFLLAGGFVGLDDFAPRLARLLNAAP